MARLLVTVSFAALIAGCVGLTKPEKVAECESKGTCRDDVASDGGARRDGKSDGTDAQVAPMDGGIPDGLPGDDAVAPDAELSDVPIVSDSAPDDRTADAPAETPRDVSNDVPPGACMSAGKPLPAGTVCRPAVDLCDVAESCDGVTADCPADKLAKAGASCRSSAGDCDIAETCDGTSAACPVDGFRQAGTVCRAVAPANLCDVVESCTGTSPACPVDSVAPSSTVCRPSTDTNRCDPAENCTGTSVTCPTDVLYTRPATPDNTTATPGTLQATVAWSVSAGATGYNVKRSAASGSGYTTLGSTPTAIQSPYVDKGLVGGTRYYYVVSAINTIATCESPNSSEVAATPNGQCTPPAAPSVTATSGNGLVKLDWNAIAGVVSYSVARSATSGTGYATIAEVKPGTTTTYSDSNVANGTTYYYVVTASNGTCTSTNSAEVSAAPSCTPPPSPANVVASPANGSVTLTWAASAGATSYSIYKNNTGGTSYSFVNSTSTTTFTDTNVVNGTQYTYVVTASNGSCSSANSMPAQVTPVCVPPSPPSGVTATPGDGQIALAWTAPTGATLYGVSRNTTGTGVFTQIATPTTASYLDRPLTNGTTYYYLVFASNGSCSSANSTLVSATPICTPPSVPGVITATAGDGKVTLSWGASTPAPASYTLQRKTGAGAWTTIASPAVPSYTDSGLINGTTYSYQVSASNGSCSSAYDAAVSATPTPPLACPQTAPTNATATATGSVQVTLTWNAATVNPSGGYDIGRSTSATTGFVSIGTVNSSSLTYVDASTGLLKDVAYYYQITAVGATCTATSSTVSATTACANPAAPSPTATGDSTGNITVTWPAVTGATAYTVYRSATQNGTYTAISSDQTAATFTDAAAGLTNGTIYFYAVVASNANGQCVSGQSAPVSARACTIPAIPAGVTAMRSGHKQATLMWTNSTGATSYNVLRSTTSASGYASIGTATSSPFTDTTAANGTVYYYVLAARSDSGGNCSSANSTEVSVPACAEVTGSGAGSGQAQNQTAQMCWITCDKNIAWWGYSGLGSRKAYVNTVQQTASGALPLPAAGNSGYAFYFSASTDGTGNWVYWNYGGAVGTACP